MEPTPTGIYQEELMGAQTQQIDPLSPAANIISDAVADYDQRLEAARKAPPVYNNTYENGIF